ncbi:MAG: hypothetical protein AABZ55_13805, partial [Bdellovibrionota bacterium]
VSNCPYAAGAEGAKFGWLKGSSIELNQGSNQHKESAASNSRGATDAFSNKKRALILDARLNMGSPGALNTALGIPAASIMAEGLSLSYEQSLGSSLMGGVSFNFSQATKSFVMSPNATASYTASEMGLSLELAAKFLQGKNHYVGFGAFAGYGVWTAGTTDTTHGTVSTSGITAVSMGAFLPFRWSLGEKLLLSTNIGYRLVKLTAVPIYLLATDVDYTPAEFNLSGIYFSLGFGLKF